jgi:hypothetical protein
MKRKIRMPGEKTQLICEGCEAVRDATWNYDSYDLDDGTIVSGVMVAHCDHCGQQAGLASQSSYLIRQAREKKNKRERTSVTLSRALRDLAETRVFDAGCSSMNSVEVILLSVLAVLRNKKNRAAYLAKIDALKNNRLLIGDTYSERLPIRLSQRSLKLLEELTEITELNRSQFVRCAIILEDNKIDEHLETFTLV